MEAYDASEQAGDMADPGWAEVPVGYWASRWHGLFGPEDFRSTLTWRGRFAGIRNAVNCYSETEDVAGAPSAVVRDRLDDRAARDEIMV